MQSQPFPPPSDQALKQQALQGLKDNDPRSYRDLLKEHQVDAEVDRMVQRCKDLVADLIQTGVPAWMAWDQARREELALIPQS
jgi:hypothetical protein